MQRTNTYIVTIPMKNEEQVIEVKKVLEQIFGWVRLRGRHKKRKAVLGNAWHKCTQNDIPWRMAQYIDIYLHPKNPNYKSVTKGLGIKRQNLLDTKSLGAVLGKMGIGFADYQAQIELAKSVYNKVNSKLQPGDWGYYVQELIDFVERNGSASHTELHNHYKKITGGSNSFSHCLINLRNPDPNRRCRRYLEKQGKRFCSGNYIVKYL